MNILASIIQSLGIKGVAKGATTSKQATVSEIDADHNALDVTVRGTPALPADAATQTTLAALLAKVIAAPATEAKQDTGNSSLSTLAGIVAAGKAAVTAATTAGGSAVSLLASAAGLLQVSTAKGTSYSSAASDSSAVVSASACSPSMVNVRNTTGTTRYVQFFNANGTPANGTVPKLMFMLTANSDKQLLFPCPTDRFSTAMTVASSSTAGTLTFSAGTDLLIQVDLYPSST